MEADARCKSLSRMVTVGRGKDDKHIHVYMSSSAVQSMDRGERIAAVRWPQHVPVLHGR